MAKITKREYTKQSAALNAKLAELNEKAATMIAVIEAEGRLCKEAEGDTLNDTWDAITATEQELKSLDNEWDTRNWDSQTWYQWSLVAANCD